MRKLTTVLLIAATVAACDNGSTEPEDAFFNLGVMIGAGAESAGFGMMGGWMAGGAWPHIGLLNRLPDNLKLSAAQQATVNSLVQSFETATKADREALAALHDQARAALQAGKSRSEVQAILDKGIEVRKRLAAAEAALKTSIDAVLTAAQKEWLAANQRRRCDPHTAPALTDAQKTAIQSLVTAFETANQTTLDALRAIHQEARAARQAGKSRDEVQAILAQGKTLHEQLEPARQKLRQDIEALLTPEQRASACLLVGIRMGMGGHMGGGRGGQHMGGGMGGRTP